jgi:hypothetical protein
MPIEGVLRTLGQRDAPSLMTPGGSLHRHAAATTPWPTRRRNAERTAYTPPAAVRVSTVPGAARCIWGEELAEKTPDPDFCAHLREQVRRIISDEDGACLGVKVRPAIPLSDEERVALATLRRLNSS